MLPIAMPGDAALHLSIGDRLRIARRLLAMIALFAWCLPASVICRAWRWHDPWPPHFLAGVARIAGVTIVRRGMQAHGRALLLANHVSWLDIPALAASNSAAFVAQDGLEAVPVVRFLCRLNHTVFVDRDDRGGIAEQIADVRAAMAKNQTLVVFPEGTTSDGTMPLPFKSSLLAALDPLPDGLAVQPVWLDYGVQAGDIAWVGVERGWTNFLRILARREKLVLTMHFLPPLAGEALASRKTIAAAARGAIIDAMAQ